MLAVRTDKERTPLDGMLEFLSLLCFNSERPRLQEHHFVLALAIPKRLDIALYHGGGGDTSIC